MNATTVASPVNHPVSIRRMSGLKIVFSWIGVSLLAFPLGGYLGWGVGGHVDGIGPALIGGALTGVAVGFAQWLLLRRDLGVGSWWIPATGIALAAGLSVGAAVVGYETDVGSLATMGAISGAAVGVAQGLLLRDKFTLWAAWMVAMPLMWAISWAVTTAIGIDVANQFTVFGASGSIAFGILAGALVMAGKRTQTQSDQASPM
jgi:hypothetical protein